MTIYVAYTLFDVKALVYHPPFFQINDALATRMVSDLVADSTTQMGRHPADFKLYRVGLYDDSKGIIAAEGPFHVIDCVGLVPPKEMPLFNVDPKMTYEQFAKRVANGVEK